MTQRTGESGETHRKTGGKTRTAHSRYAPGRECATLEFRAARAQSPLRRSASPKLPSPQVTEKSHYRGSIGTMALLPPLEPGKV